MSVQSRAEQAMVVYHHRNQHWPPTGLANWEGLRKAAQDLYLSGRGRAGWCRRWRPCKKQRRQRMCLLTPPLTSTSLLLSLPLTSSQGSYDE